jgi:tetratricopeptide (TPR) repeat protein
MILRHIRQRIFALKDLNLSLLLEPNNLFSLKEREHLSVPENKSNQSTKKQIDSSNKTKVSDLKQQGIALYHNQALEFNQLALDNLNAQNFIEQNEEFKIKIEDLYKQRGDILKIQGKPFDTLQCYKKSKDLSPHSSDILLKEAEIYFQLKSYKNVLECTEQALKQDPISTRGLNIMGLAHMELESFDNAVKCFEKIPEIDLTIKHKVNKTFSQKNLKERRIVDEKVGLQDMRRKGITLQYTD